MTNYCDTSKVTIERTTKEVVYDMVVNKHYAGRWTGSTDVLTMAGYTPIGALFPVELTFLDPALSIPYESIVKY